MTKYPMDALTDVTPVDLSWLVGTWKAEFDNQIIEEHWSAIGGGDMVGMFRWQKEGKVWFYEMLVMEGEDNQVFHRLKHFNRGMKGWEEKDEFVEFSLVQLQDKKAVFLQHSREEITWLIYHANDAVDKLEVYFEHEDVPVEDKFVMSKVRY